ncbi:MAG: hypothetical protein K0S54_2581 [Alphaproteobacteria bacterium]|jgi:hypothetical protein|nr:hypothetical protein [Alphaproteobacteria bacterium]
MDEQATLENQQAIARQHAADGALRVARQRGIVARIIARGHPAKEAIELLDHLLASQRHFQNRCHQFERQLEALRLQQAIERRRRPLIAK